MKISLCMIVKNEEEMIRNCLNSVKDYVDEIIVVDTGSTDNTISILKEFGATIIKEEWEDSYSKHRNTSISKATGDWILQIDADEVFVCKKTPKKFKKFLKRLDSKIAGIFFFMKDIQKGIITSTFPVIRCFRNGKIHFKDIVHNKPVVDGLKTTCDFASYNHFGYDLNEEKTLIKNERRERLLLLRLNNDPYDFDAMFYLSQHYGTLKNHEKAIKYCTMYVSKKSHNDSDFRNSVYYTLSRQLINIGENDEAFKVAKIGFNITEGKDIDISYLMVELGILKRDLSTVILGSKSYLRAYERIQKGTYIKGESLWFNFRIESLSYVLYHYSLCRFQEARNHFESFKAALNNINNEKFINNILDNFEIDLKSVGVKII